MSIFQSEKDDYIPPAPEPVKKPSTLKIAAATAGALFAVAHIGLLGYLIDRKPHHQQFLQLIFPVVLIHLIKSRQEKMDMRLSIVQMILKF